MAPSMAANINPQGTAGTGRPGHAAGVLPRRDRGAADRLRLRPAVPVLPPRRLGLRLRRRHARPAGRRGRRPRADGHLRLLRAGHRRRRPASSGRRSSTSIGVWNDQPDWAGFLVGVRRAGARAAPGRRAGQAGRRGAAQRRGHHRRADPRGARWSCWSGCSAGNAPGDAHVHHDVFTVPPGTADLDALPRHHLRPAVVRRLRGGGHPRRGGARPAARHPPGDPRHRDLRRRLLHRRHRHRDDGLRHRRQGRGALHRLTGADGRPRDVLHRRLGRATWSPSARAISAFACCLACVVGASRLLFAITRDLAPGHALGRHRRATAPRRPRRSSSPP